MDQRDLQINLQILQGRACGETNDYLSTVVDLGSKSISRRLSVMRAKFDMQTTAGAIRHAMLKRLISGPELSPIPLPVTPLVPAEKKVLDLLLDDATTEQIAEHLTTTPHNIHVRVNRINRKYVVHSREHLVAVVTKLELMRKDNS